MSKHFFTEVTLQFEQSEAEVRVYRADEVDQYVEANEKTITDLQETIVRLEKTLGLQSSGNKKH